MCESCSCPCMDAETRQIGIILLQYFWKHIAYKWETYQFAKRFIELLFLSSPSFPFALDLFDSIKLSGFLFSARYMFGSYNLFISSFQCHLSCYSSFHSELRLRHPVKSCSLNAFLWTGLLFWTEKNKCKCLHISVLSVEIFLNET